MTAEQGQKNLGTQLEQSLLRLAGQEGSLLVLKIDKLINTKCGKSPINRTDVHESRQVNIGDLSHVFVGNGEEVGLCVRLIFGEYMYANCGEKAQQVIAWAVGASATRLSSKIPTFPDTCFQQVVGKVKIVNEEIVLA
ncbi:MAG: hypothetical protein WCT07_00380 [Candidatus Paceibacterota bacterium]|jgi:hypothetical protein